MSLPAGVMDELELIPACFSSNSSMTPAGSILGEHYQILQTQSSAAYDGRKYRPKHVELTWSFQLIQDTSRQQLG